MFCILTISVLILKDFIEYVCVYQSLVPVGTQFLGPNDVPRVKL